MSEIIATPEDRMTELMSNTRYSQLDMPAEICWSHYSSITDVQQAATRIAIANKRQADVIDMGHVIRVVIR